VNNKVLIVEDQFVEAIDLQLMLRKAGYEVCEIARSVAAALEQVKKEQPGLVLVDIFLQGKLTGIDLAHHLKKNNIAFIYLSANSNEDILAAAKTTEPYGFIVKPFREKDLLVTLEIARYRHEHSRETRIRKEAEAIKRLSEIASGTDDRTERLLQAAKILQQDIPFDYFSTYAGNTSNLTGFLRIGFYEYQTIGNRELAMIRGENINELDKAIAGPVSTAAPAFFNEDEFEKFSRKYPFNAKMSATFQMRSQLTYPVVLENGEAFNLCFYSRRPGAYSNDHIEVLDRLHHSLAKVFEQKQIYRQAIVTESHDRRNPAPEFEGIIGSSHLLLNVFDLISQVAPFDTAVLVFGESGTGKEKIAECIHNLSPRKGQALIKVNCATLPATLIESELFGHEKGSFTGATDKRIGKFEQANGGTIFLDEIGEMPVDLQVKLLRVLQEKEIEPIGSRSPVKINVRIIAATNKNLEKEVGEGRFRLDLYYRLNVFPIFLPALRERLEDIPVLAEHFMDIYNRKSGKKIFNLSDKLLSGLMTYSWPGNIRELENLIERSVLLAKGSTIEDIPLPGAAMSLSSSQSSSMKSIHENERDYIISALQQCNGKIYGSGGAAEMLKLPGSTLKSKMKKLGIEKPGRE
jgi:DNA-binding NtrC family response regulator